MTLWFLYVPSGIPLTPLKKKASLEFGIKGGPSNSAEHLTKGPEEILQGRETEASGGTVGFCVQCVSAGLLGVNHLPEVEISTSSSLPRLSNHKKSYVIPWLKLAFWRFWREEASFA